MPSVHARLPPGACPRVPVTVECEGAVAKGMALLDTGASRSAICSRAFQSPASRRLPVVGVGGRVELDAVECAVTPAGLDAGWRLEAFLMPDMAPGDVAILGMDCLSRLAVALRRGALDLEW